MAYLDHLATLAAVIGDSRDNEGGPLQPILRVMKSIAL
jgi:hypothetical protein